MQRSDKKIPELHVLSNAETNCISLIRQRKEIYGRFRPKMFMLTADMNYCLVTKHVHIYHGRSFKKLAAKVVFGKTENH